MLTAKYYQGLSATTRGTPIAWCWRGHPKGQGLDAFVPEAVWNEFKPTNEGGATCVSHSRLWIPDKVVYVPTEAVSKFLHLPNPQMCETSFLQKICDEPLSPCSGNAGILPARLVQKNCTEQPDALTSYIPNHAHDDFQLIPIL
jgi:hypothetical protein